MEDPAAWQVWLGPAGVLVGVIVGGFLTVAVTYIQGKGADRRLKIQLDHDAHQRQQDHLLTARLEPVEDLETVVNSTLKLMPRLFADVELGKVVPFEDVADFNADIVKAATSMFGIRDDEARKDVLKVQVALTTLTGARPGKPAQDALSELTTAVALLSARHMDIKLSAIRTNGSS